jgi:hypothetical protein
LEQLDNMTDAELRALIASYDDEYFPAEAEIRSMSSAEWRCLLRTLR